ncbi:family 1 glycosylhydrolase [Lactiplantibacillus fabifermentans]|uniref:6-phospho-beta-glucosidase n=1 Tax=Lactiplantibacillus fabifermentans DSM 21115 TaxID=1413187 RepID=A0A0R2N9K7_9LACO|nr:hypothetical protein DY78_GL002002 [Lactiplantibacillus fabifermentans DSM 21115]
MWHLEIDVKLKRELGMRADCFSMTWSRVIPDGVGDVNWHFMTAALGDMATIR